MSQIRVIAAEACDYSKAKTISGEPFIVFQQQQQEQEQQQRQEPRKCAAHMEKVDTPPLGGLSFQQNGSEWDHIQNKQVMRNKVADGTILVPSATG